MLRFAIPSLLLLSAMAASQTVRQAGLAPPDSIAAQGPASSRSGQSPTTEPSLGSALPAASLNLEACAPKNDHAIEINQTPVCLEAPASSELPDAPTAGQGGSSSANETRDVSGSRLGFPTLAEERNTRGSGHTMDRNFILLHALSTVALFADLETTARSFQGQGKATELNPLFGAHPTRARLYGIAVPLNVLSFYFSYHYKKIEPGRSFWKIGPGLTLAVHTAATINNLIATHR
jgi:hypothetical protein